MARRTTCRLIAAATGVLLACGTRSPAPTKVAPSAQRSVQECGADAPSSASHCECLGGYVRREVGDGTIACPQGETQLGRVQQSTEGAVCCTSSVD